MTYLQMADRLEQRGLARWDEDGELMRLASEMIRDLNAAWEAAKQWSKDELVKFETCEKANHE